MFSPVVVDFPLRGEWITPNTPGTRVPSHGTDMLGERYAYDFVGVEPGSRGRRFYRPSPLRYLLLGVRLQECFGWGRPIFATTAGVVVRAEDGWPERSPVHPLRDLFLMLKNARSFRSERTGDIRALTGNFVVVAGREGYAVYAHAQTGSLRVTVGEQVAPGQWLANVGHSGNSTAPHLHFQLMDRQDHWQAQGIPCCFRAYEVLDNGAWRPVENGIPRATDRIRRL
ncbi:MAG: M23 family metallopeptidase [Chloroflexota bacterium]